MVNWSSGKVVKLVDQIGEVMFGQVVKWSSGQVVKWQKNSEKYNF